MKRQYEIIDHTADLGLRVFGRTREDLFSHAARAMFEQIADLGSIRENVRRALTVEAPGLEELLVCFLSELLYLFTAEDLLLSKFTLKRMDDRHLEAEAGGEVFSSSRHQLKTEIKAVTYHNLKIEHQETGWKAEIIFDT
jgi:SHS2 domain-containing protein